MSDNTLAFKVLILGDGAVGKSTLVYRLLHNEYKPQSITTGLSNIIFQTKVDGNDVVMSLWDLGGQKQFQPLHYRYIKGVKGIIYTFDLSRYTTMEELGKWAELINLNTTSDYISILVGTKSDLISTATPVDQEASAHFLQTHGSLKFFITSAKENSNVKEVFEYMAQELVKRFS